EFRQNERFTRHRVHRAQHVGIADATPPQREQKFHARDFLVALECRLLARLVRRPFIRRLLHSRILSAPRKHAAPVALPLKIDPSRAMNGSSVRSSRSAVTEMRLLSIADKSVPSRGFGRSLRAKVSQ